MLPINPLVPKATQNLIRWNLASVPAVMTANVRSVRMPADAPYTWPLRLRYGQPGAVIEAALNQSCARNPLFLSSFPSTHHPINLSLFFLLWCFLFQ